MACAAACYCCPCFFFKLPSGCKLNCKFVLIPVVLYDNFIINDQLRQKNKKIGKKGLNKSNRHITHHYKVLLLFSVSGEKAEVTIAILPLLLAKAVICKHKEFVEFISVSVYWLCLFTLHKCVTVST